MEAAKLACRKRARAARRRLSPSTRAAAHDAMAARLFDLAEAHGARVVGVYAALADEADPGPFADRWQASGGVVAWPRVEAVGGLGFHLPTSAADLVPGYRGIREPSAACPRLDPRDLDLLVVPGVAFDRFGGRVGQGGGFYDRLLATAGLRALLVGLCYAAQVVPRIPAEAHDRDVDAVVTERGVARGGFWQV